MPRVPVYESQVEARGLPGVQQQSVASPEVLGDGGQMARAGVALARTGAALNEVAVKFQERENADMIFRAETAITEEYIAYHNEAKKRLGANAKGLTQDTTAWWEEAARRHSGNLGNDSQRNLFAQRLQRQRLGSIASISEFEGRETDKSETESWAADKQSSIALAVTDPSLVGDRTVEITNLNAYMAKRKGWTPAQLAQANLADTTELHKQVIQEIARTNPVAAARYFETNRAAIDPRMHAEIGGFADKISATAIGAAAASDVWNAGKPPTDKDPVRQLDMEDRIRKSLAGNEPAIDAAIKDLRERISAFKVQRAEVGNALEAKVNEAILKGMSSRDIRRMPEMSQMNPESARRIDGFLESRDASRENRAAAAEARAESAERRREMRLTREGLDTALRLSNPTVLAGMTRDQVVNTLPVLGPDHTSRLVAKWDAIKSDPAKLAEARIDDDLFKSALLQAGMNPNDRNRPTADKDREVVMRDRVEAMIDQQQRVLKRPLNREEKKAIMQREIDDRILMPGWFGMDGPARPASMVLPREIPTADRKAITESFKRQGVAQPTEDQIAAAWVARQPRAPR